MGHATVTQNVISGIDGATGAVTESDMWIGWRRSFEALLDDPHPDIASMGRREVEITKSDERRALERERYQAVHGT